MLQFGEQRIATPMLRTIETRFSRLFKKLGVKANALSITFGTSDFDNEANYFELPGDWLALCYYYKLRNDVLPLVEPPATKYSDKQIEYFVQHNRELLGFAGIVTTREGLDSSPAVFLNSAKGTPAEVCHTLIHELVHAHSYKSRGFQNAEFKEEWSKKGILAALLPKIMSKKDRLENVSKEFYTVLDEGVTELFARVISKTLGRESFAPAVPRLNSIPVYEFPLAIACDLAGSFGLSTLAKSYFDGDLEFHKKLAERARKAEQQKGGSSTNSLKYSDEYFHYVSGLDINSGNYLLAKDVDISKDQKIDRARRFLLSKARSTLYMKVNRLSSLGELGVKMPDPHLLAHTTAATYNDPAVALWNEQLGNIWDLAFDNADHSEGKKSITQPVIATVGAAAAIYTAFKLIKESK